MVCDKSVVFACLTFSNRFRSWKMAAHPCAAGGSEQVLPGLVGGSLARVEEGLNGRKHSTSHGLARTLSKMGICSRTQAGTLILAGAVQVNGRTVNDPELRIDPAHAQITINGEPACAPARVYIALNKPRGLVTTRADEKGRATVYECLAGAALPYVAPVGRLDQASEGLLLLSNDSGWNAAITDPANHLDKIYHVQIGRLPDAEFLSRLQQGALVDGELLQVKSARELRRGGRNAWLEITLDEGRNRHLRRLLAACDCEVLRLIRVGIGPLQLGALAKGAWRPLSPDEVRLLAACGAPAD